MKLPRLHKKGNAYYRVTGTKPRVWTPLGSDLAEALRQYQRLERAATTPTTIAGLIDAYLADPPAKWSKGTVGNYDAWGRHLIRVFGHLRPEEIGRREILEYLDRCPRTSGPNEIMLLRQVYERAVRRGYADTNPCIGAKPERRQRPKRTRYVTDGEMDAIRRHACPLLAVAIDLAYLTALRSGDLCRARWSDFVEHVETQKTGARIRFTLNDELRAVLDQARSLQGRVGTLTVLCERGHSITRWRLGELWRRACKAAGVAGAQFRDLRAKSATDDPDEAQKRLGHKSPQTTRVYMRGREIAVVEPTRRRKT